MFHIYRYALPWIIHLQNRKTKFMLVSIKTIQQVMDDLCILLNSVNNTMLFSWQIAEL